MFVILIIFNHSLNCDVSLPAVPQQGVFLVFLFPSKSVHNCTCRFLAWLLASVWALKLWK